MISDELTINETIDSIIDIIRLLKPNDWPKIKKIARLRIENRLIEAINEGNYDASTKKCTKGVLGAWATGLFPFFTLKREAYTAICGRLFSGKTGPEEYALKFLACSLPSLSEKPNAGMQVNIKGKLKAGHQGFYDLISSFVFSNDEWSEPFQSEIAAFTPPPETEDDVPF